MKEIAVLGGGLAGASAAGLLARAGRRVVLFERSAGPEHKMCGEFLSLEAQRHLAGMGFKIESLGAPLVDHVRLIAGTYEVEAKLPFTGLSITRRLLDEALLEHSERLGARIERGVSVTHMTDRGVETSRGAVTSSQILLATGKHDVRGARRNHRGTVDDLVGFKNYFSVSPAVRSAMAGVVEIVFFQGGYAGLQLVEGGLLNLCLLVRKSRLQLCGGLWTGLLAELMREVAIARRLDDAEAILPKPLSIANVPYGFQFREPSHSSVFRLGDQASVIPSFCGDGMAIALHSARLASSAIMQYENAQLYHARLRRHLAGQMRRAMLLQRASGAHCLAVAAVAALHHFPKALTALAKQTRISSHAMHSAEISDRA